MPKYFFNVVDGRFLVDDIGTDCLDMKAVRLVAIATAGELLRDTPPLHDGSQWQMHVTDSTKLTVMRLTFSIVVPVPSPDG